MGSPYSFCWTQFYYSALFAYVLAALFIKSKLWVDEVVGGSIVGAIWGMYLIKPILPTLIYDWMRFALGVIIFIFTIIYIIYDWHRKPNA